MEALNVPLLNMSPALPDNVPDAMLMVIYYAALPGVCEEVFFRGAMLGAFERMGTRAPWRSRRCCSRSCTAPSRASPRSFCWG